MTQFPDLDNSPNGILQRMLDEVDDSFDKREGSIIYDALAPIALEQSFQYEYFRDVRDNSFASRATGIFLDYEADDYGILRQMATFSFVVVKIVAKVDTPIPIGTQVGNLDNNELYFTTVSDVIIGASGIATVSAICNQVGVVGNVMPEFINYLISPISDVEYVINESAGTGGVEREDDEQLRARVLFQKRNPEQGGTKTDYERWSLTVAGVEFVRSIDKPRGIGSVDVIIGADLEIVDAVVLDVQDIINLKKPLGLDVEVRKMTQVAELFRITVVGLDPVIAYNTAMAHIKSIVPGTTIYLSQIASALVKAGALDAMVTEPSTNVLVDIDKVVNPTVVIS